MQRLELLMAAVLVAGSVMASAAAVAQPARAADKNCPLPGVEPGQTKLASGGIAFMTVKNPGPKNCPGGQCQMQVEVQSYTNTAGAQACCVRAEFGSFVVKKLKKDVVLRWNLNAMDSHSYVFNPGDGVRIISPPPNPGDFGPPTSAPNGQWFKIPSLNGRAQEFNYGFTVFRKNTDGSFLHCDPNDPLIVNQGQ